MQLTDLNTWVEARRQRIEDMLRELVEINTYTSNIAGVDRGMNLLGEYADEMGFTVEVINGRHRLVKSGDGESRPRILLISHMDTVFPPNGEFLHYEPLDNGFIRGPGTGDIKGGLTMGLWAMKALSEMLDHFDVQMIVSADEEKGSPTIRDWYMDGHIEADYAIGLEPGFPQGDLSATVPLGVVYQRRGYATVHFTVHGTDSHSGTPEKGLSAIEALAQRITKLHALSDFERGLTVNVGMIDGGISPNTVAGKASATVSFRYWSQQDGEELKSKIEQVIMEPCVHNKDLDVWDSAEYTVETFLPPMEPSEHNQVLIDTVLAQAERLGHNVTPIARGGGSDANYISGSGTPSICGMGAPCSGLHTDDETIYLPMLFERVNLLASTMHQLYTS
jgi:glutamate carboxypeptidase